MCCMGRKGCVSRRVEGVDRVLAEGSVVCSWFAEGSAASSFVVRERTAAVVLCNCCSRRAVCCCIFQAPYSLLAQSSWPGTSSTLDCVFVAAAAPLTVFGHGVLMTLTGGSHTMAGRTAGVVFCLSRPAHHPKPAVKTLGDPHCNFRHTVLSMALFNTVWHSSFLYAADGSSTCYLASHTQSHTRCVHLLL